MGRSRGVPAGLNRTVLRRAVLAIADQQGLEALTVRGVARHLGVEAMSIYHYFPTKDALLEAAWDEIVCQLDPEALREAKTPAALAELFALQLRRLLLQHPKALPIMLGRHVHSTEAMTTLDQIVGGLHERGLPLPSAVQLVNTVSMFTMAHALNQVHLPQAPAPEPDPQLHPSLCAALEAGIPSGPAVEDQSFRDGITALIRATID